MHANDGFGCGPLKEDPCFWIDDLSNKVIGRCIADIELDRTIEFCEFYQIGLSFTVFFRRPELRESIRERIRHQTGSANLTDRFNGM